MTYSVIVSQSFMYLLALRDTSLRMDATCYIQFRKLVDENMQAKFRYAVYAALLASLLLIPIACCGDSLLLIAASLISFCMLVFDTILTMKGNLPINATINSWTENHYPADWKEIRADWLRLYRYRQILNIIGFAVLIAGVVFR